MPSTHRGVPTGDNHRPTPRLKQLLAHEMGYNPKFLGGAIPEEYREETAQNMIDSHRYGVSKGRGGSDATPLISDVVKNRQNIIEDIAETKYQQAYWSTPSPYQQWLHDDGKRSYLYDHPEDY